LTDNLNKLKQVIVFDITVPIMTGTAVEFFHLARNYSATISKLIALVDRSTGTDTKLKPRVLPSGASARIQIDLRPSNPTASSKPVTIPIETFATNKDLGRFLLRRQGETIAAGIIQEIL